MTKNTSGRIKHVVTTRVHNESYDVKLPDEIHTYLVITSRLYHVDIFKTDDPEEAIQEYAEITEEQSAGGLISEVILAGTIGPYILDKNWFRRSYYNNPNKRR